MVIQSALLLPRHWLHCTKVSYRIGVPGYAQYLKKSNEFSNGSLHSNSIFSSNRVNCKYFFFYSHKSGFCFEVFPSISCIYHQFHTLPIACQKQELSKHVKREAKFSEKAKDATKTTYYGAVVLAGLCVTCVLAYTIYKELFASFSPQSVYSDAVAKCTAHPQVQDMLGSDGIKCYGEETRRGRRQHVSHLTYEVDGQRGMRIKFHIKGSRRAGTAQLDARDANEQRTLLLYHQSSSGWYYRYLYVQQDQYPHRVAVVLDNRGITDDQHSFPGSESEEQLTSIVLPK